MHSPCSLQALQSDQTPFVQLRRCVPQLPQDRSAAPSQSWPSHSLHWHSALQVWVPPLPQAWAEASEQAPCALHSDQSDQRPPWHCRVCVPQSPQLCALTPSHASPTGGRGRLLGGVGMSSGSAALEAQIGVSLRLLGQRLLYASVSSERT
jgi:hypothetical protein